MDLHQALRVFEIKEGFFQSKVDLKAAFRKLSMVRHPDCGGSAESFIALKLAYDYLRTELGHTCPNNMMERTIEGDLISDLGKGYSIDILDVGTCDICSGKGYRVYHGADQVLGDIECPTCNGVGLFSYSCKYCKGTGKYKKTEKHSEIECRACKGTGKFYPINKYHDINFKDRVTEKDIEDYLIANDRTHCISVEDFIDLNKSRIKKWYRLCAIPGLNKIGISCKNCYGLGRVAEYGEGKPYYSTCFTCGGLGEVELHLFNPVLRRYAFRGNR
jgi:hypothetical protein